MALVVLLRGANLGKRRFSPVAVAEALADLDVASIGAAGTFVVGKRVAEQALRRRVAAELAWPDPPMVVLRAAEVRDALRAGAKVAAPPGCRRFGLALPDPPPPDARFPLVANAKDGAWGMRYELAAGRVVVGVRRRFDETGPYSTREIDAAVGGASGTMRDWPTWEKIGRALDAD